MVKPGRATWEPNRCGFPLRGERKGEFCQKWAIRGGTVCGSHGGTRVSVLAKAREVVREGEAMHFAKMYGLPVEITPADALLKELHNTQGHVDWLREKVQAMLEEKDLVWSVTEKTKRRSQDDEGSYDETKFNATESMWLKLYRQERAHLLSVAGTIIKLGIAESYVRIAAQQAEMFEIAIVQILDGAGVDKQSPAIRELVASTMRTMSATAMPLNLPEALTNRDEIFHHVKPRPVVIDYEGKL